MWLWKGGEGGGGHGGLVAFWNMLGRVPVNKTIYSGSNGVGKNKYRFSRGWNECKRWNEENAHQGTLPGQNSPGTQLAIIPPRNLNRRFVLFNRPHSKNFEGIRHDLGDRDSKLSPGVAKRQHML